jgi:Ca2+-transporting ATPase
MSPPEAVAGMTALAPPLAIKTPLQPVHLAVPGRARWQVAGLRGCPALARRLERGLAAVPEVLRGTASARTGTVLVLFDPALPAAAIAGRLTALLHGAPEGGGALEEPAWHAQVPEAVAQRLGTSLTKGLTEAAARQRLAEAGPNRLGQVARRSGLAILADQFRSLPVLLLAGVAVLSFTGGALLEAAAIGAVLLLNGGLGFAVESRSERRIEGLMRAPSAPAWVRREGAVREVPLAEVVPGDFLLLRPGTLVPADARVVAARELTVNEAMLTGESLPVAKTAEALPHPAVPLAERASMVYRGTAVTGGTGLALAVATGPRTEMGRIQRLLGAAARPATPMERQLDALGRQLVGVSLALAGLVLGIGWLRGFGLRPMLGTTVSLAVAAIPEGLPTVATAALARGVEAMRREGAMVRRLDALETLGAAQVVCLDKTGTLTRNRMAVARIAVGGRELDSAACAAATDDLALRRLMEVAVLCSDAMTGGASTEGALLDWAGASGLDVPALRRALPRLAVQHRSEAGRFMVTRHRTAKGGTLLAVKGSPEEVLDLCTQKLEAAGPVPLTPGRRAAIERQNFVLAQQGLRVLGFAWAEVETAEAPVAGLTWLGLVGLSDPLRPDAPGLLTDLHRAGVHCLVLTGDQVATARAVAAELGLGGVAGPRVIDSLALDGLDAAALARAARQAHVVARVTPAQKLRVVQALQQAGITVAMIGDGLNDGPALKAADVGIALGRDGAEAAREIADIVLQEDALPAVVSAMRHGRATRANVRRAVRYLLGTNLSEILLVLAATTAGVAAPLTALQLLWINLVSDVLPGIALAAEPPEPGLMERPPPAYGAPVLDRAELRGLALDAGVIAGSALAATGFTLARHGGGAEARTVAFGSLTVAQLLHALACRPAHPGRAPNRALVSVLALTALAQGASLLLPGLRRLLGVAPLDAASLAAMLAGGLVPLAVNGVRRAAVQSEPAEAASDPAGAVPASARSLTSSNCASATRSLTVSPSSASRSRPSS